MIKSKSIDTNDLRKREPEHFDNEFHLYKARAYSTCGVGDDRIQVRVLPQMQNLPLDELDNLPKYAPFFRGNTIQVSTEKESLTGVGSLLWVIALPDFTFGYVLGEANSYENVNDKALLDSWPYNEVSDLLSNYDAISSGLSYKDITVQVRNSTGTFIEFYSIKTGEKWMMTEQGDLFYIAKGKVMLQASSGVETDADRSSIVLSPTSVSVTTGTFSVNAKQVLLGTHGHRVLGTLAKSAVSYNGMNLKPIENVFI